MKAILLSAGKGERLRPITDDIPKVMLPVGGKPILQHWIELLKKYGIKDIAINLHYLGEQIENYFGNGERFGVNIKYSKEETLMGTATPIKRIEDTFPGFCSEEPFLVIYADNLSNMNLEKVVSFHQQQKPLATLTMHNHDEPKTRGIITTEKDGKVTGFVEKPSEDIIGKPASCVYIFEPGILKFLRDEKEDLGTDVFPRLLKNNCILYAFDPKAYVQDIGTISRYEKAKREWPEVCYDNF